VDVDLWLPITKRFLQIDNPAGELALVFKYFERCVLVLPLSEWGRDIDPKCSIEG
jgi:hypothetical protein